MIEGCFPRFCVLIPVLTGRIVVVICLSEFTSNELLLALYIIIDVGLPFQVVLVLVHSEGILLYGIASFTRVDLYEGLLIQLANWDTVLISDDATISNLLIDCRIVDECGWFEISLP